MKIFLEIFFIFLLIENLFINSFQIKEKYPKIFYPTNNNFLLFLVTENGIRIYDAELEALLNSYNFTSNDRKITSQAEAELTSISQFDGGIIIALIKKYLYAFDTEGNFLADQDLNDKLLNGEYYNLFAGYITYPNYYYIISYYDSNDATGPLSINYFCFSAERAIDNPVSSISYLPLDSEGLEHGIVKNTVRCVKMFGVAETEHVLTCFYQINDPTSLGVTSFKITEESIEEITDKKAFVANSGASVVKISSDKEANNILACYTNDDNHSANCVTYNLNNNEFTSEVQFFSSCKEGLSGMEVYYFSGNSKYMLICSDYSLNKAFHVIIFDDININEYTVANTEPDYMYRVICNKVYLFNIILISWEEDYEYFLINDCGITDSVVYTRNIKLELLSQDNNYPNIPDFSIEPETEEIETYDLEIVKIAPEFQYMSEHNS